MVKESILILLRLKRAFGAVNTSLQALMLDNLVSFPSLQACAYAATSAMATPQTPLSFWGCPGNGLAFIDRIYTAREYL